ncbi:glycosyltransferase [Pseudotamlana carrageenivorans]|uniref:Group 1 glycosyl transferase n=1 Tax=Pseudotamlana carrageenivorans TaxID=2069432 RepID=A0A2I7SDL4_9FLAO|nr:glycosyltransferase [Tamlana carrageenivorans]AUS03988.1 group 1 glycosyl transferase [Tamlana carrageenivorans]
MLKKIKHQLRLKKLKNKLKSKALFFNYNKLPKTGSSILIIDGNIPEYNKDSGSRRLLELMKMLLDDGYKVFLMADLKEYKYTSEYISYYQDLGVHVYEPRLDNQGDLITKTMFVHLLAPHLDVVWLHRPETFNKYFKLVKQVNNKVKLIYDMVDFHYLRNMREYELNSDTKLKVKAEKYLNIELENCENADKIVVISDNDKVVLSEYFQDVSKMVILGNVHDFLKHEEEGIPFNKRSDLLFVGGFAHKPNTDAVLWLKKEIMPLVWSEIPDLKINIIGGRPPQDILDLNDEYFKVLGFVEDVSKYFNSAKLFVAPLRFGAGVKGKIGQSFEFGLPVVTTEIGAEGFDFSPFESKMVGNSAENIASCIINMVSNEELWTNVKQQSEHFIAPYSLKTIHKQLVKVLS